MSREQACRGWSWVLARAGAYHVRSGRLRHPSIMPPHGPDRLQRCPARGAAVGRAVRSHLQAASGALERNIAEADAGSRGDGLAPAGEQQGQREHLAAGEPEVPGPLMAAGFVSHGAGWWESCWQALPVKFDRFVRVSLTSSLANSPTRRWAALTRPRHEVRARRQGA